MIIILVITVVVLGPFLVLWLAAVLADAAGESEWRPVQRAWDADLHRRYVDQAGGTR